MKILIDKLKNYSFESHLANRQPFVRVQTFAQNLFSRARREISCVVKQFVNRVAFQVVAHFRADFAFNRLTFRLFVALSSMLLKLIERCHDDGFTKRTKVLRDWQPAVKV